MTAVKKIIFCLISTLALSTAQSGFSNGENNEDLGDEVFFSGEASLESLENSDNNFDELSANVSENCVQGRTCADLRNGTCYIWNTTKACGRYCATGKRCGYQKNNTCFVWEVQAACGRNACTVNRTCGASRNGTCFFYEERVSCY